MFWRVSSSWQKINQAEIDSQPTVDEASSRPYRTKTSGYVAQNNYLGPQAYFGTEAWDGRKAPIFFLPKKIFWLLYWKGQIKKTGVRVGRSGVCAGLFKIIFGFIHSTLQMQPHVISFYGVTSRIRFMFLLFPQVSRNWRYESEPSLKPLPLTCYKQFGMNSIIVFMFVESLRVHI